MVVLVMCKRPLILSTLYPVLANPNCSVVREEIIRYTEEGIFHLKNAGEEQKRDFDVIILGIGFSVAQYMEHGTVIGKDGIGLQDQ